MVQDIYIEDGMEIEATVKGEAIAGVASSSALDHFFKVQKENNLYVYFRRQRQPYDEANITILK